MRARSWRSSEMRRRAARGYVGQIHLQTRLDSLTFLHKPRFKDTFDSVTRTVHRTSRTQQPQFVLDQLPRIRIFAQVRSIVFSFPQSLWPTSRVSAARTKSVHHSNIECLSVKAFVAHVSVPELYASSIKDLAAVNTCIGSNSPRSSPP